VVCSSCGFDNQAGMRFCGMCGTPLPHRPITAPGAHSTLNFTRVPVDSKLAEGEQNAAPQDGGDVLLETPVAGPISNESTVDETPPSELVPDVPLQEYVQRFHYEPPNDPAEVTMRGDAHVAHTPASPADNIIASSSAAEVQPPAPSTQATPAEDVDDRLGLEPESAAEARIARPRFLDINPPKETQPANSGTSISGPSFLGLNDSPQTWSDAVGVEAGDYAPRTSHWRAWLAFAVVVVIGALGVMEWRSQSNLADSGPVQVIRAEVRSWRHGAAPQNSQPAPVAPAKDANAKPEIQVQEQPKPSSPDQAATAAGNSGEPTSVQNPASAASAPADQPTTGQSASAPPSQNPTPAQSPATAATTPAQKQQAAPVPTQQASTEKPKSKRPADPSDDQEVTVKEIVPGAEEMNKARDASDAAAEAAWLWKATAKGNPDAPVELADMYIKGEGVPRSCEQAVVLLKTAAAKENAHARNRLASMYATGNCVPRNRVEAYRWVSAALNANPNSEWAKQNRTLLWQQMSREERLVAAKYR